MQAEERKQLERNVLAQQLNRAYEGIKHGPSRGTIIFLACIIAAVAIFLLFRFFWFSSAAGDSQRWLQLDQAIFTTQLDEFVENKDAKDTPQGRLARFREARMNLAQGLRDYSSNPQLRNKALDNIAAAVEQYEKLADSSSRVPLLHQEALWGQAKGAEALGSSKPLDEAREQYDKARELYEKLAKTYPNSALGKDAKKQIDRLNSPATQKDLKDLAREFGPLLK
jgi:uncharacterized membrane protein YccC